MAKLTLKKVTHLRDGYAHMFRNDATGKEFFVETSQGNYHRMGEKGGSKYNPKLAGSKWICSVGGIAIVDTSDVVPQRGEYYEKDGKIFARNPTRNLPSNAVKDEIDGEVNKEIIWQ